MCPLNVRRVVPGHRAALPRLVFTEGKDTQDMPTSEEELYQEHVLDHYEQPYHRGQCAAATHRHEDDNPLCGDVVQVELKIDDTGRVQEAWFDGDGCCISQASASMLVEAIEGKSIDQLQAFGAADMLQLFGAKLTPNRQKCCLLAWRVAQSAVFSPADGDGTNHSPESRS